MRRNPSRGSVRGRNVIGLYRRLRCESLEERRLLAVGDLLHTLDNPSTLPQAQAYFGSPVATDGELTVVGAQDANVQGFLEVGRAYVFNSTTGVLVSTLINPTPAASDWFGCSVAISGNIVVVGADADDTGATNAGAAYLFDATSGALLHTLTNPSPAADDQFGGVVAISGNTVVVGARNDDTGTTDAGAAYIFDAATGSRLRTLANPTPNYKDYFGDSVAVSGSRVVVGAYSDDSPGMTDVGTAHIFDVATGNLVRTLASPRWAQNEYFGNAVAISGNTIVVGAYRSSTGTTRAGVAYIFDDGGSLLRTLANPTPKTDDYFGNSVAISGDTVAVGAVFDDTGRTNSGAAYVFSAGTGSLVCTLTNPTPAAEDRFGSSVAVSGNTVVAGAWQDDTGALDSGAAYIFHAVTGDLLHTLENPTPSTGDNFGSAVAVSDSYGVVGAFTDNTGVFGAGVAHVFDVADGSLLHTLTNPTPAAGDGFGGAVAISGRTVVVGAMGNDTDAVDTGTAYIFDAATGGLLHTLTHPTLAASDHFGASVGVSGNTIVVGEYLNDMGATDAGAAYVFDAAGKLLQTLLNPTPENADHFGGSVAVSGSTVVVGALYDDTGATNAGAAYLFDAATGQLLKTLSNPSPAIDDWFGGSVAISGNIAVVGASHDDTSRLNAGAAYLFDTTTGNLLRTLLLPSQSAFGYFGTSVAISGSTVVVGASGDDAGATDAGTAYVFDAITGQLLGTLSNPTPTSYDWFATSVAASANRIVVGADGEDAITTDRGAAYVFDGPGWDFGDAPDPTYPTLAASNGARHVAVGPMLGAARDVDADGQPDATATGDDLAGTPRDEDGVVFTSALIPGKTASVEVTASAPGKLDAWIDFDGDGSWGEMADQIFASQSLAAGVNSLTFTVPLTAAAAGTTFARLRLSSAGGLTYTGPADDGEVEDYQVQIAPRPEIRGTVWNDLNNNGAREAGEAGLAGRTVFADLNSNGLLDAGEPSAVSGSDGTYAITGLSDGPYQIVELVPMGWDQTSPRESTFAIPIDANDIVFDSNRNLLYASTDAGVVRRFDMATRSELAPLAIGNQVLRGMDITPDGQFLYLAGGVDSTYQIAKVNLDTSLVTAIPYTRDPIYPLETGPWDVVVAADGYAFFTTMYAGSGSVPLRKVTLADDQVTVVTDAPESGASGSHRISQNTRISRSADYGLLYFTESNSSSGPSFAYDAVAETWSGQRSLQTSLSNRAVSVSRDGSLVAISLSRTQIYDASLNPVVTNLADTARGLAFDPVRDLLYLIGTSDSFTAYDTNNWSPVFTRSGFSDGSVGSFSPWQSGQMTLSDDGHYLFVNDSGHVDAFRLLVEQSVTVVSSGIVQGVDFGNWTQPLSVVSMLPARDSSGSTAPTDIHVEFNLPIDPTTVDAGDVTIDGQPASGITLVGGSAISFPAPALSEGTHTLVVIADSMRSIYGGSVAGYSGQFSIDWTPPVVTVNPRTTGDSRPALSGSVDDPKATIRVTVDGVAYDAANRGNGTWVLADDKIRTPLSQNAHDVTAEATDRAGNVGRDTTTNELTIIPPAQIAGTVWNDYDANGLREPDEPSLAGWRVYVDLNGDGLYGPGEPYSYTSSTGSYLISDLDTGTYTIREDVQFGWRMTAPAGGGPGIVSAANGQAAEGPVFGNHQSPLWIEGTEGSDVFAFSTDGTHHALTINGTVHVLDASADSRILIDGNDGDDTLTITGGPSTETVTMGQGSATIVGPNYWLQVTNVKRIDVDPGAGDNQTAVLNGGEGIDRFYGRPDESYVLYADGSRSGAKTGRFVSVEARASAGGTDTAYLYDSPANDTFTSNAATQTTAMTDGASYHNIALGFKTVYASSNGGTDLADMAGTTAADTVVASLSPLPGSSTSTNYAYLLASTGQTYAYNFTHLKIDAAQGANEKIHVLDSPEADLVEVSPAQVKLSSQAASGPLAGRWIEVNNIGSVYVTGGSGAGRDSAALTDSDGNDIFWSQPRDAHIAYGTGSFVDLKGFADVTATGGAARDTAYLYDSATAGADDTLVAGPRSARMTDAGGTYVNTVSGFASLFAYSKSGEDQSTFSGSDGNDVLTVVPGGYAGNSSQSSAIYKYQGGDQAVAFGFRSVEANGGAGGTADIAYLWDSPGDDIARLAQAVQTMETTADGARVYARTTGFDQVYAKAYLGGQDQALFEDSAGSNFFYGSSARSYFYYGAQLNEADAFEGVDATFSGGGDQVKLAASRFMSESLSNTDHGTGATTRNDLELKDAGPNAYYWIALHGLDARADVLEAKLQRKADGTDQDTNTVTAVDYLFKLVWEQL